jgi:predicted enzyme related to lactoylglutathione lyase
MHRSRLCAVLIDCQTPDVDEAARFWGEALGRPVDPSHPGSRGNYRMLETLLDEPIVQIQRVDHESRVHIDIETDDIPAEVTRLEQLGAKVVDQRTPTTGTRVSARLGARGAGQVKRRFFSARRVDPRAARSSMGSNQRPHQSLPNGGQTMRKVITGAFVSLDGVVQAPGGPQEDPTGGF